MILVKSNRSIIMLGIIVFAFATYNFMNAAWTPAPAGIPPANNAEAPVNVGATYQAKTGDLGAVRMRAGEYCDAAGANCFGGATGGMITLGVIRGETNSLTLTAQSLCTAAGFSGVWAAMNVTGLEDIICFSSPFVGKLPEVQTFVSAYFAMRSDPSFISFWGSALPNYDPTFCSNSVNNLYSAASLTGGPSNSLYSPNVIRTYDGICSYMMVNGKWKQGTVPPVFDSGSDSGNNAIYWSGTANVTVPHNWNDFHDALTLTCTGDSVTTQGNWWVKSSRPEAYGRSGNKYPAPPLR